MKKLFLLATFAAFAACTKHDDCAITPAPQPEKTGAMFWTATAALPVRVVVGTDTAWITQQHALQPSCNAYGVAFFEREPLTVYGYEATFTNGVTVYGNVKVSVNTCSKIKL